MQKLTIIARELGWCWCWSPFPTVDKVDLDFMAVSAPAIIWVMGPKCSGKTSIAEMLQVASKFSVIPTSKLLKKASAENEIIAECILKHVPVPDELVISTIKEAIAKTYRSDKGYIIDGFPLDLKQAKLFEFEIAKPAVVVYCNVSADDYVARCTMLDSKAKEAVLMEQYRKDLARCYKTHLYYEMKTLKVRTDEVVYIAADKIINDLNKHWGFKFLTLQDALYLEKNNW